MQSTGCRRYRVPWAWRLPRVPLGSPLPRAPQRSRSARVLLGSRLPRVPPLGSRLGVARRLASRALPLREGTPPRSTCSPSPRSVLPSWPQACRHLRPALHRLGGHRPSERAVAMLRLQVSDHLGGDGTHRQMHPETTRATRTHGCCRSSWNESCDFHFAVDASGVLVPLSWRPLRCPVRTWRRRCRVHRPLRSPLRNRRSSAAGGSPERPRPQKRQTRRPVVAWLSNARKPFPGGPVASCAPR